MGELDAGIRTFSRIFGLSLNAKKIAIQILGILALVIAWHVIHGIGALILGDRLPWLVEIAGWIAVIFILFFSWGAIARVTVGEVAGLPAVDIGGALRSARKACAALVMAPLKIVAIILILALIHAVVDLVGKIPFLGEIVWPFFAIPLFFLSALMVAAKIILVCGALLLPSIIMAGKQSPVSELNDFLREHALRFIGYLIATLVVVFLVFAFLNMVVAQNDSLSMRVMGDKYTTIATSVPSLLNGAIERVAPVLKIFSRSWLYTQETLAELRAMLQGTVASGGPAAGVRFTFRIGGLVWGLLMLLIYLSILSLPFVIWCVAGTLIYLGLKPEAAPKA